MPLRYSDQARRTHGGDAREPLLASPVREPLLPKDFDYESPKVYAVTPLKLDIDENQPMGEDAPPEPEVVSLHAAVRRHTAISLHAAVRPHTAILQPQSPVAGCCTGTFLYEGRGLDHVGYGVANGCQLYLPNRHGLDRLVLRRPSEQQVRCARARGHACVPPVVRARLCVRACA
jgi:hypothetical protein